MNELIDDWTSPSLDRAACGLLLTDTDDLIVEVNATFLDWTGYARAAIIGRPFHDLLATGHQAFYATQFLDRLWAQQDVRSVSLHLLRADGSDLAILASASMVTQSSGSTRVRLAVFDASSREDLERELLAARRAAEASESSVRILHAAATSFLGANDDAELATTLAAVARDAFAASQVIVVEYEQEGRAFRVLEGQDFRPLLDAVRATRESGPTALPPDSAITISDLDEAFGRSDEVGRLLREARASALSIVSIADGEVIIGAFVCLYGRPRTFDQATIELHHALAKQAGLALSRVRLQSRLRTLALTDQLTGVASRIAIDDHAALAFEQARRDSGSIAAIFLDLDGFKRVNDEFGHRAGDIVLQEVARRIRTAVRSTDVVGRFGGDEFLIIGRDTDADAAGIVATRIAEAVRAPIAGLPDGVIVTASIGIAAYDPRSSADDSAEAVTRRADAAMYASKRGGRDRIEVAEP